jgi:osmotically-inducible protein OsmY
MERRVMRYLPVGILTVSIALFGAVSGCTTNRPCGSDACQSDAVITAEVNQLFGKRAPLEAPNILTVETMHRVVYLHGEVATDLQREMAESVAYQAPGVAMVVNDIAVTEK